MIQICLKAVEAFPLLEFLPPLYEVGALSHSAMTSDKRYIA